MLVTNPFNTSQKLNFPQPVKPRTAWRERMREREKAMELINYDEDKTCERNFDDSLDSLVLRDEALLRDGFSSKRKFMFCLGFDGADNFTHVTLRLTDYKIGIAEESELKVKQLAVAMGDDHFPRLERIIAPRIGPAVSSRTSVMVRGVPVPAEGALCLDLSAQRSAYGRRSGKNGHTEMEDVHAVMKLPDKCTPKKGFELLENYAPWLKNISLCNDAHSPSSFPFKCRRDGCGLLIKSQAEVDKGKVELALLNSDKTVNGKKAYTKAIAIHCDLHGQQMPYQRPVTDIPTKRSILDLLHALDLNLPKVDMKYTILDPVVLDPDMRMQLGDFFSEIGCPIDVQDKEKRDNNRKWFHGSVWHYDFVRGANKKSYSLHVNVFQLCLIVYGVHDSTATTSSQTPAAAPSAGTKRKEAPSGLAPHPTPPPPPPHPITHLLKPRLRFGLVPILPFDACDTPHHTTLHHTTLDPAPTLTD